MFGLNQESCSMSARSREYHSSLLHTKETLNAFLTAPSFSPLHVPSMARASGSMTDVSSL